MKKKIFIIFFSFVFVIIMSIILSQSTVASEVKPSCAGYGCDGSHDCVQIPRGQVLCILIDCDGPGEHYDCGELAP